MYDYDIPERHVTLTFDEYRDLVADASLYHALKNAIDPDKFAEIAYYHCSDTNLNFYELDLFAFSLMEDEDGDDYELSVAYQWLQHRCETPKQLDTWCTIISDLAEQLIDIYKIHQKED